MMTMTHQSNCGDLWSSDCLCFCCDRLWNYLLIACLITYRHKANSYVKYRRPNLNPWRATKPSTCPSLYPWELRLVEGMLCRLVRPLLRWWMCASSSSLAAYSPPALCYVLNVRLGPSPALSLALVPIPLSLGPTLSVSAQSSAPVSDGHFIT